MPKSRLSKRVSRRVRNKQVITAIDIGASKLSCFIARVVDGPDGDRQAEIIGVGHHGSPASAGGRMSGRELEQCLSRAVDAAERMSGERVHDVCVAAPGRYLRTRRIGVEVETAGGLITQEDVDDCIDEGAAIAAADDCAPLHANAIGFRIDGEEAFHEPVGLSGNHLSVEMLGVAARQSLLDNISGLVERCGLTADIFVAGPVAAADATLLDDEKDLGVVLIDIGATTTDFAVFDDGVLIDCGGVKVGGSHITRDIAQIFGAPLGDAERIKNLHGAALPGPGDEHRFVEVPQLGVVGEAVRVSRADLCDVIIPRMEEIFELVRDRLPDDQFHNIGLRRAVITGGGSLLVGARETAERTLSMKTRIGRPMAIMGAPEAAMAPGFSVCAGLLQHVIKNDANANSTLGVLGQSAQRTLSSAKFGGVEAWLRAKF